MTRRELRRYYPRMRRCWTLTRWCLIGTSVATCVLPLCAQHHPGKRMERAEIQAMEERWRKAQLTEDCATMEKLLSDEFLGITAGGQVVTKVQQLDRMRARELEIKRLEVSDTKIKISGNLAVVTSLAELDGVSEGRPLQGAFRYTRVYQRVPGDGWQITNFEATRVGQPSHSGASPGEGPPRANARGPAAVVPSSSPAPRAGSGSPQPPS